MFNPMTQPMTAPDTPAPAADAVYDVDMSSFMKDVIEASKTRPVIVDFWSARSAACKQLMPVLEKLVVATKGALRLAKMDIDRNPEIALQMGVESVPAVFAFFQGRPVDGFMGPQSPGQIKNWVDHIVKQTGATPTDADAYNLASALKQAEAFFASGEIAMAQAVYADVQDAEPGNADAYAGLIRCLLADKKTDAAKAMLDAAPPDIAKHKALAPVRAAIELASAGTADAGAIAALQAKVAQNPADHQSRFDLATALYAAGRQPEAVDHLLDSIKRDRTWNEEAARKQLVKLFEALGPLDPLTVAARKRLSSILFA